MHRIPPSQRIGKKVDELLRQGLDGEEDVTTAIIRLGVERLAVEMYARGLSTRDIEDALEGGDGGSPVEPHRREPGDRSAVGGVRSLRSEGPVGL